MSCCGQSQCEQQGQRQPQEHQALQVQEELRQEQVLQVLEVVLQEDTAASRLATGQQESRR
jgi:hypothetical protein